MVHVLVQRNAPLVRREVAKRDVVQLDELPVLRKALNETDDFFLFLNCEASTWPVLLFFVAF